MTFSSSRFYKYHVPVQLSLQPALSAHAIHYVGIWMHLLKVGMRNGPWNLLESTISLLSNLKDFSPRGILFIIGTTDTMNGGLNDLVKVPTFRALTQTRSKQEKRKIRITGHLLLSAWVSKGVAEAILNDVWDPFHAEALKAAVYGPGGRGQRKRFRDF